MLKIGIIGLPNVGKSTLFNAITKASANISNYPFTTIEPNIGIVEVPDKRPEEIAKIMQSRKAIRAAIEFVDIAGLVRGASKGEGLGNRFLANIREVDAVVHVVRCFADSNITHVEGAPDPARDIGIVESELLLADLSTAEKKLVELKSAAKGGGKKALLDIEIVEKIREGLSMGRPARKIDIGADAADTAGNLFLLTSKPQIFAANVDESALAPGGSQWSRAVEKIAEDQEAASVMICSKLEEEIRDLPAGEAEQYMKETGITENGLEKMIKKSYSLLGLITFFTSNEKETRAWTVKKGATVQKAAGRIHTDMEKGFVSAEAIQFEKLKAIGSYQAAREAGQIRLEGRNYQVNDGDLIYIRFAQ